MYIIENLDHDASIFYGATKPQGVKVIQVDSLPSAEERPGKTSVLKVNVDTKQLWYEYIPIVEPESPAQSTTFEDRLTNIENTLDIILLKQEGLL